MEVDIETSDLSIETNGRSLKAPSKWEIVWKNAKYFCM
jgi:hypothetical protein